MECSPRLGCGPAGRRAGPFGTPLPAHHARAGRRCVTRRAKVAVRAAAPPPAGPLGDLFDDQREQALKYRRVEYDQASWAEHRRPGRFSRHIRTMLTSRIVRGLRVPIALEGALSSVIVLYDLALQVGVHSVRSAVAVRSASSPWIGCKPVPPG